MCGISGFVGNPAGVQRLAMVSSLAHRGPDDQGEFHVATPSGETWLATRRLAILDLSTAGHQPMASDDGRYTLVYNGEVYNFEEIRAELRGRGAVFRSAGDTEVVLRAWEEWGPRSLSRFHGMFALAVWDGIERTLVLARDRLGEKPLYYSLQKDRLVFASELRCLLESGVVPRRFDSDGLDAFLAFGSAVDPLTVVQGVRALEAGCSAVYREGKLDVRRYWSVRSIPELGPVSRSEATASVGALLRQSIGRVMRSDVPVGILLSGGIDSSSNVVLLSEAGFDELNTFSVTFEGLDSKFSEEPWSQQIARTFATRHHPIVVTEAEAQKWVVEAVRRMDSPSVDGVNTFLVCHVISESGIKVAISGQGGDELFLGYHQRKLYPWLARVASAVPRRLASLITQQVARLPSLEDSRYEKLGEVMGSTQSRFVAAYASQHSIFSRAGVERLRGQPRPSPIRFLEDQGGSTPLNRLSRLELTYYLRNTLLRDGDQMSMANSLELRQPFLDHRLVEAVVGLPSSAKVQPGRQKPLLVQAVGPRLPRDVVQRPKQGFSLPLRRWLQQGLAVSDPVAVDIGLRRSAVEGVRERFHAGAHWPRFWSLQVLAAWADLHRVGPPS